MDPDANLKEQLEIAEQLQDPDINEDSWLPARLAELVLALDEWIKKGGFLPTAWRQA